MHNPCMDKPLLGLICASYPKGSSKENPQSIKKVSCELIIKYSTFKLQTKSAQAAPSV